MTTHAFLLTDSNRNTCTHAYVHAGTICAAGLLCAGEIKCFSGRAFTHETRCICDTSVARRGGPLWEKRAKPTRPLPTPNKSLLAEARDDVPWRVAYLLLLIRWAPTRQHEVNALCMRPARIPHRLVRDTVTEKPPRNELNVKLCTP